LKQRRLKNLGAAYDQVIEIGVPEWGVAALHDKAEAFAGYGANFRQLQIPAKIQGDERKETELGLKKIEADIVAPLDKQAEEMFKLCAAKAAEFHVATEFAAKCRARTKGESRPEATGQVPSPTIASQPAAKWEGTAPSVEDSGYVDYLASLVGSRDGVDKKLKEYLRKNPQNSKAVYLLGLHYQKIKRFELAQYFFNQLEKDNRFEWKSFLLNNHGLIALSDHNKELAVEYFEKAEEEAEFAEGGFAEGSVGFEEDVLASVGLLQELGECLCGAEAVLGYAWGTLRRTTLVA
jgi:tetratricopeptide (TPR) repeat protein